MSSPRTTALTVAGLTVCGLIAYAVYFDYKRRNDTAFRKQLRKEKKRVDKSLAESREALAAASSVSDEDLVTALRLVQAEPKPGPEAREDYFMRQVAAGEQMVAQGGHNVEAALAFYRALSVYPSPPELLAIYQKTVPEEIVKLILRLINIDITSKVEAYSEVFPPKWAKVAIQARSAEIPPVTFGPEKVLVLTEDVAAGQVIYKEQPMLTCLDYDLQKAGTHCAHCFRVLPSSPSPPPTLVASDGTKSRFCSTECQQAAKTRWHTLLCTLDAPLPSLEAQLAEIGMLTSPEALHARREAQAKLQAYLQKDARVGAWLVAQFIARQLTAATEGQDTSPAVDFAGADAGINPEMKYRIEDHVERWTTGPVVTAQLAEEYAMIVGVLKTTLPGLEAFLSDESHKALVGKLVFNAFGVSFGNAGRTDRPPSTLRPEHTELTRTPLGTEHQVGSATYGISAYLPHSCAPNCVPTFPSDTAELSLVAAKDLKKGDELTIAYVDVKQREGEGETDCRMRRRKELARGWRFACQCERCLEEVTRSLDVEDGKIAAAVEAAA
ncbi:SET domain-containing protein [Mycena kentingensis (nom. inval.)]|nr:SET domain-containing protein [Mycena kentingensis (nom. inval.)]